MSAYFGNGYFLNILQRGAAPVGRTHSALTQAPVRLEETVTTTSHAAPEVFTQTFASQNDSLDRPQTTSTATQPLIEDQPTESLHIEAPVSPVFDMRSHFEMTPNATPEARDTPELIAPFHSSEPASRASFEVTAHSTIEPFVPTVADESFVATENPRPRPTSSRVFELRMPENFFGHTRGETSSAPEVKPAHIVSAVPDLQTESQPAVVHFPEPAVPAEITNVTQTQSVVIPERTNALTEIQTIELSHPGPTSEPQVTPPRPVENEVMVHVSAQPPRLVAAEIVEAPNTKPRVEHTSAHLQPRQPSFAPAPVVPPARLHINRVDIQVINQVPPPPPAARVPDISQLLEKRHAGRVELLL